MAEVYTFAEGYAYTWTGNATNSSLLTYVRGASVALSVTYQHYKPPHAIVYTNYPIASAATLSISQARAQLATMKNFSITTGGGIHFHLFESAPNLTQSAGVFLYSGNLNGVNIAEQTDSEVTLSLNAIFPTWSAY